MTNKKPKKGSEISPYLASLTKNHYYRPYTPKPDSDNHETNPLNHECFPKASFSNPAPMDDSYPIFRTPMSNSEILDEVIKSTKKFKQQTPSPTSALFTDIDTGPNCPMPIPFDDNEDSLFCESSSPVAIGRSKRRKIMHPFEDSGDDDDDEYVDTGSEDIISSPVTPPLSKKTPVSGKGHPGRPRKTPAAPLSHPDISLVKRSTNRAIPQTFDEADEADRMLWSYKHSGKGWDAINREWERITGKKPAKSTLSVRWIKLRESFTANSTLDDVLLIKYKQETEKELESELWERVAQKISAYSGHTYHPEVLRKRFNVIKDNGWNGKDGLFKRNINVEQTGPDKDLRAPSLNNLVDYDSDDE